MAKFVMLPLGGLHAKHAMQSGIWVPTQHLLWDQGEPRKTLSSWPVAGPSGCKLTSSQQSGINSAKPNNSPYLCSCFSFVSFSFFKKFFLQLLLCAYDLDKHQTVYNTCERNKSIILAEIFSKDCRS
jgi:hypothetical protein